MRNRLFDLVIWDWNGTLQNDLHYIYDNAVKVIFEKYSVPCPTLDEYRDGICPDFMQWYWKQGIPRETTRDDLNAILKQSIKDHGRPAELFGDAFRVVTTLCERGYQNVLVSAFDITSLSEAIHRNEFTEHFLQVVGDVKDKAPEFDRLIREHNVSAERCVVIGDTVDDALAGHAVGATAIICSRGFHTPKRIEEYFYIRRAFSSSSSPLAGMHIVESLEDLLPFFP